MKTQKTNILIVHSNRPVVNALRQNLNSIFGKNIDMINAYDEKGCLEKMNNETNIVILGNFINEKNHTNIISSMKIINPDIEIILLSDNSGIYSSIENFRKKTSDSILKVGGVWRQILSFINKIITIPFHKTIKN